MTENNELEKILWAAADKMRSNIDSAEYKHVVLGLIFLKYISDAFNELYQKLAENNGEHEEANPEDPDEYLANNYVLMPGRYVGTEEAEDDGVPFEAKKNVLTAKLAEQFARGNELQQCIARI